MNKLIKKILTFSLFCVLIACEDKVSQKDIDAYKEIMDIRLGHLGNAIIMQGRLLDAYNLSADRADEDHFKEAEELIKNNLEKLGRPDDLKELKIPNSKKIKSMHNSIIESSKLMLSAMTMLEDQAWLGGSVSFAENSVDKARFNFQEVVGVLYELDKGKIKPVLEHKEYEVGERPDNILPQ